MPNSAPHTTRFRTVSATAAVAVGGFGFLVLIGWVFEPLGLIHTFPDSAAMKANTAAGFLFTAAALWLVQEGRRPSRSARAAAHICAIFVLLIGLITFWEYLGSVNLGIDQFLVRDAKLEGVSAFPGRQAPNTAACFVLLGLGLALMDAKKPGLRRLADGIEVVVGLHSLVVLIGYAYGASRLFSVNSPHEPMAVSTAVVLGLATLSALTARSDRGVITVWATEYSGSLIARRLLLPTLVLPILIDSGMLWANRAGWIGANHAQALSAVLGMLVLLALLWIVAASLNRTDALRCEREQEIARLNAELERKIVDRTASLEAANRDLERQIAERRRAEEQLHIFSRTTAQSPALIVITNTAGEIEYVNPKFTQITGYTLDEVRGENPRLLKSGKMPPEEYAQLWETLKGGGEWRGEFLNRKKNGELYWASASISPILDEAGCFTHFLAIEEDITERKLADQRLAGALNYSQVLLQSSPIGIVTYCGTGKTVSANPAVVQMVGGTSEQMVAQDFRQIESWKQSGLLTAAEAALATGQPQNLEVHHHSSFGKELWLSAHFVPFEHEGQPHLLGMFVDITERKHTEEARSESEERFRQLTENINEVFWLVDASTREFLYVSPAYELIWRRTCESLYASRGAWEEAIHPEDRERVLQAAGNLTFDSYDEQYRIVRPDGSIRWIRSRTFPIKNAAGEVYRMAGVAEDVTARHQAESILQERILLEERLSKLTMTVPGTLYAFRLRPDGSTCFPYASPKLYEMFGMPPEAVLEDATPAFRRVHAEDLEGLMASMHASAQTLSPWNDIFRAQDSSGTVLWVEGRAIPEREPDGGVIWHGILLDITDRKRAEAELEETHRQLLTASRQAGMAEVATGLLHNVGNVLNSVNVTANLLTSQVAQSRAADLDRVVALLRQHQADLGTFLAQDPKGRRVTEFLGALAEQLEVERNEQLAEIKSLRDNIDHIKEIVAVQQAHARVSAVTEAVDLTLLMDDALRMNGESLGRRHIQVVREYARVPTVVTERHKVLQILVNLVRNAMQACDGVHRRDHRLTLAVNNGGEQVRLSVTDTGVGIAPEHRSHLFTHGFTTKKDGHGFGLHSSALAARELGGTLAAHSDGPGHGARFTLELPVQNPAKAPSNGTHD